VPFASIEDPCEILEQRTLAEVYILQNYLIRMQSITLISTIHVENGSCNSDELCRILENLCPEVIFLEALEETYTQYNRMLFSSFGVYHKKLEIKAIQKYSFIKSFEYVPILDAGLTDAFKNKYNMVLKNIELQKLLDNYNTLAKFQGFKFLNSIESNRLQEEMRILEGLILNGSEIGKAANKSIDEYEHSMIQNIYSFCKNNQFKTAIFMCGVAHRKSLIEKIERYQELNKLNLNWIYFE
jgi:DNA-binding protein Fis